MDTFGQPESGYPSLGNADREGRASDTYAEADTEYLAELVREAPGGLIASVTKTQPNGDDRVTALMS